MGKVSQILSVSFRIGELICATIVVGILGRYLSILDEANANENSRLVYAVSIAAISMFFSIVFMPPLLYSFYGFPIDFALFICWMVAFGLLVDVSCHGYFCTNTSWYDHISNSVLQLTGSQWCESNWYWHNWGYYWGGWWRTFPINQVTQSTVGTAYCSSWRTSIAFEFIGGWLWLGNGLIVSLQTLQSTSSSLTGG